MNDSQRQEICVHIDITEILTGISSARVGFHMAQIGADADPAKRIEVIIPFQVLLSLAQSLPKVLQDMQEMGAGNTIFGGGGAKANN